LSTPVTIAVDCMGGDHGVAPVVDGVLEALEEGAERQLRVMLVGDQSQIQEVLEYRDVPSGTALSIEHADDVIAMDEAPTEVLRRPRSSIAVGLQKHKDGAAQGFISPGNTGAVMAAALRNLQRLPGVMRPAIASLFPNPKSVTVVLDVGANTECKPQNLLQWAVMGSVFSQLVLKHQSPRVGLLSIGEERTKGTDTVQAAHDLLHRSEAIHFVGNVEGRGILSGEYDVVVTDGYVGNILLKFAESVGPLLEAKLRHQVDTNVFSRAGAFLLKPFLRRVRQSLDYAEHGGAPMLGVDGVILICHGASGARAIKNAIFEAERSVRQRVNVHIKEHLQRVTEAEAPRVV